MSIFREIASFLAMTRAGGSNMLPKLWVAVLSCFISLSALAQDNDSLYVVSKESKCYLEYTVKPGETLFMLAKRYHCPPALLADANGLTYRNAIKDSTTIYIPLGDYNFLKTKPEHVRLSQIRRIFHKAASGETDIFSISRNVGVSRDNLQQWNKGYDMIKALGLLMLLIFKTQLLLMKIKLGLH